MVDYALFRVGFFLGCLLPASFYKLFSFVVSVSEPPFLEALPSSIGAKRGNRGIIRLIESTSDSSIAESRFTNNLSHRLRRGGLFSLSNSLSSNCP